MNLWLLSAGLLIFLIGLVHSILGETRIFRHLRGAGWVPTQGAPLLREYQLRIVWGSWHLVTVLAWTLAALLIWQALPGAPAASQAAVVTFTATSLVASAALVVVATRGKHPAWIALLLAAALAVAGVA